MPESITQTSLLSGRLRLLQPVKGHRAGMDAVLLAACLPHDQTGLVLDIGAGVGAVGLAASQRATQCHCVLLEREPVLVDLAAQNIALNALQQRVRAQQVDILSSKGRNQAGLVDRMAQAILTNPPFYAIGTVRQSPEPLKARAYAMDAGLDAWLRACAALLAPGGHLYMIHLASALATCLAAMQGRFGDVRIIPVHSRAGDSASRLLIRATKGSRAAPSLRPSLVMHEGDGSSQHGAALLEGRATLRFDADQAQ